MAMENLDRLDDLDRGLHVFEPQDQTPDDVATRARCLLPLRAIPGVGSHLTGCYHPHGGVLGRRRVLSGVPLD
jgi:hypothetical protein